MARCIRKLENENLWVIYCNTSDILFSWMFESFEAANKYVELWEKYFNKIEIDSYISEELSIGGRKVDIEIMNLVEQKLDDKIQKEIKKNVT